MKTTTYSAIDICKIVKACHEAKVESITLEGIEIRFLTDTQEEKTIKNETYLVPQHHEDKSEDSNQHQKELNDIEKAEEEDFYAMNDPAGYEQSLITERHSYDA